MKNGVVSVKGKVNRGLPHLEYGCCAAAPLDKPLMKTPVTLSHRTQIPQFFWQKTIAMSTDLKHMRKDIHLDLYFVHVFLGIAGYVTI